MFFIGGDNLISNIWQGSKYYEAREATIPDNPRLTLTMVFFGRTWR